MASPACVARIVQRLLDCCSAPPSGWSATPLRDSDGRPAPSDLERRVAAWLRVLEDLTDYELSTAALEYARGPKSAFMPAPGELLQIARPPATDADLGQAGREAWQRVQVARRRAREYDGRGGYRWYSEQHERWFAAQVGDVACAALATIGGIVAVERAGFCEDGGASLQAMEHRFVADFRALAKRAAGGCTVERPQISATPTRAIAEDGDLAVELQRRLAERRLSVPR